MGRTIRLSIIAAMGFACLTQPGCGQKPPVKNMHGSVTCAGEKVTMGKIVFVPFEDTSQPPSVAMIVDGLYDTTASGGVPLGKYRVQVNAQKKTGRKVRGSNGIEIALIDEDVQVGSRSYAGEQSPLVADVRADSDGVFDIVLPSQ